MKIFYIQFKFYKTNSNQKAATTLRFGINVGPTFINFWFFLKKVIVKLLRVALLHFFPVLHLFWSLEYGLLNNIFFNDLSTQHRILQIFTIQSSWGTMRNCVDFNKVVVVRPLGQLGVYGCNLNSETGWVSDASNWDRLIKEISQLYNMLFFE